jgi:hypothetical protein
MTYNLIHNIEALIDVFVIVIMTSTIVVMFLCVGYLFWVTISECFWDNFKIANGRLKRRRVRRWSFEE